ncbi:uncharacterized protein LOC128293824 [Gossypium arboreum]|uniref:uncharacterized protein LOC128293824 n=1 Tax=Gossypium arboreum TaxID=29729 RepID=UPI0022F1DBBA|nr:uncharacterized protein LOC128293824 [Gossypium arboreum]
MRGLPKKKARADGPVRTGPLVTVTGLQPCTDCGRRHQGECWRRTGACLRCGSLKHRIKECPLLADQMQASDTDIRSTHSYIASNISRNLEISVESITSEVTVLNPLGQSARVSKLCKDVPLEVHGAIFMADLIELLFREFDLILGIDWLVKHRVSLDCVTKRVVLKIEEDKEGVMIRERQNYLSNMISALVAEKMVHKGCEAFVVYGSVSDSGDSTIKDIRTVNDFLDVFSEELPGLPRNCELEFGIELLPGTAPVSTAPYRMAPKELVELKAMIQELCY